MIEIGIDTGGTFTDFVIFDGKDLFTHKVPSTPSDPSKAIMRGLENILGDDINNIEIIHGTTVATNALLERKGAKIALITTKGFEDIIEIGRQNRDELYNLFWEPPEPLVKRGLRFGVDERVNSEGRVLRRLNVEEVKKLFAKLNRLKVEGIAIAFLNSYANSTNEKKVERILKPLGIPITRSSKILPEFREYERTSTIVANSFLQPKVKSYMDVLSSKLKKSRLLVMQSTGGVIAPKQAGEEPVRTLLSGPAGGVVGGYKIAETLGFKRVITYDMGGTSTDISLCDTSLMFTTETNINGIPIRMPMVDLITIGAGGGSIANIDSGGALKVGPESAGADPGPACYGKGDYATVTDANVLLGRINPHWFLGGKMNIYPEKSRSALNSMSTKLKLSLEQVAEGIIKISNANMERALRVTSIGRGFDPREFALFSYGGAGGLHACELAIALGIKTVIFPTDPGTLSALGMLMAESFKDYSHTTFLSGKQLSFNSIEKGFSSLKLGAKEDFPNRKLEYQFFLDARYKRQSHEITIPFTRNFKSAFHKTHKKKYGYQQLENEIEIVTLRLRAIEKVKHSLKLPLLNNPSKKIKFYKSKLFYDNKLIEVKSFERGDFFSGFNFKGPALIFESTSTLFILPDFRCEVDKFGSILARV